MKVATHKPSLGRVVIYADGFSETDTSAIITHVYAPAVGEGQGDAIPEVSLTLFGRMSMPLPVDHVKYSADRKWGTWRWPERV